MYVVQESGLPRSNMRTDNFSADLSHHESREYGGEYRDMGGKKSRFWPLDEITSASKTTSSPALGDHFVKQTPSCLHKSVQLDDIPLGRAGDIHAQVT
jgi:hypothetical protein